MQRDLACVDLWEQSLRRSRARRAERPRPAQRRSATPRRAPAPAIEWREPRGYRDLTDTDLWAWSRRRSRERREAAAAQGFELPARGVSVAALVALTGGPVAGVAVAKVLGGRGGASGAPAALIQPAARTVKTPDGGGATPAAASAEAPVPLRPAPSEARPAAAAASAAATTPAGVRKASSREGAESVTRGPTAAAATAGDDEPTLRGVRGLQQVLGVPVDGDFGAATAKALKRWQKRHGLAADGVAGRQTRQALGLGRGPALKQERARRHHRSAGPRHHRRGGGVAALQRALGVPADGVFGRATEHALKRWQRRHGLAADGVAGPQTRRGLGLGPGPVLKPRERGHHGHRRHSGGGGGGSSIVQRVIAAANSIAGRPYRYGGGHGSWNDSGYDCSGSVSYALHGGGLLSSPLDSSAFMSYGAPGSGRHITIFANPGHVYMTIDGRRYDTSARSETGSRWSSRRRSSGGYVVRHPPGL